MIYSSNLLEHVSNVNICLKECRWVLKDDGLMLHIMPNQCWKIFNTILSILKIKIPKIHGVSKNHYREFIVFGKNNWKKKINNQGLQVSEIIGLPFYFGLNNSFIPIIKIGNYLKFSSSYLYVIKK